jgi:hypothetical protein
VERTLENAELDGARIVRPPWVLFVVRARRRAGWEARRELRVERVAFWEERTWERVIVWAVVRLARPMRPDRRVVRCILARLYFTVLRD